METGRTALGIIPARGGSKGVPRKNIRLLAGRPLLAYTVDAARASHLLTKFVVSTDDEEIATVARLMDCEVIMRPADLATDTTPTLPVVLHAVDHCRAAGDEYYAVVLLQPTAPLRTSEDIDISLQLLFDTGADSVVSVTEVPGHYHPDWQFLIEQGILRLVNGKELDQLAARRQMLSETYTRNGAIYAVRCSFLLRCNRLLAQDTRAYVMPEKRSINIDSELDLQLAEILIRCGEHEGSDSE